MTGNTPALTQTIKAGVSVPLTSTQAATEEHAVSKQELRYHPCVCFTCVRYCILRWQLSALISLATPDSAPADQRVNSTETVTLKPLFMLLRRLARKRREAELTAFSATRPDDSFEAPADLQAIREAEQHMGDFKLKSDPEYIPPEVTNCVSIFFGLHPTLGHPKACHLCAKCVSIFFRLLSHGIGALPSVLLYVYRLHYHVTQTQFSYQCCLCNTFANQGVNCITILLRPVSDQTPAFPNVMPYVCNCAMCCFVCCMIAAWQDIQLLKQRAACTQ